MTVTPYINPGIVNGRTKGKFRVMYVASKTGDAAQRPVTVPVASALMLAAPVSLLLWSVIALLVF